VEIRSKVALDHLGMDVLTASLGVMSQAKR